MCESVVMIHGMWGGAWYWSKYRCLFESAGYRCVAVTLPYHDMNPRGVPHPQLGTTSLLDYADALEQEIRQLGEIPIVIGHSMGGLLAQMLAARGLAKALILLTPASPSGIFALTPSVVRSFWSILTTWCGWRKPMRQTFSEAVYSMLHLLPKNDQVDVYDRFVYESGKAACEIGFWMLDPRAASRVDESKITCPVLVVAGAQDRITPVSIVCKVAKKYGAVATYKEFDNHAHWVVGEPGWEEVAMHALEWLKSLR